MPKTEDEFFSSPWRDMTNEQVAQVLVWSKQQSWWCSVYSGFAVRSTGRGKEVMAYLNAQYRAAQA